VFAVTTISEVTPPFNPHVVIGQVTIQAGSTASTATVSVTVTVASPTVAAGAVSEPATVTVTVSIPLPTFFSHSTATAGTVGGTTSIPSVALAGGILIQAAVVQALAEVGAVNVTTFRTPFRGWGIPIR
jgi:hypothetical protein